MSITGTRPERESDASLAELVKQLSEQTTRLVHQEIELAKAELTVKGKRAGLGAGMFGGAGLFGLYALWMFAGSYSVMSPAGALPRARWLWHAERFGHLPSETAVQHPFLSHPLLVQACNLYYDVLHFPLLGVCLVWLYARHRDAYPRIRTTIVLFTAASLLIQLIPVAPPRLLPMAGLVDTAVRYGQSVYSWSGGFDADEFSAMPSVHVGWALIVAIAVITVSRRRWRWLAAAYPVMTLLVVVVTANHFWLDGIAAALLVTLILLGQRMIRGIRSGKSCDAPQIDPARDQIAMRS